MAAGKGRGRKSPAKAARKEVEQEDVATIKFKDLEITLPTSPSKQFYYDMAEINAQGGSPMAFLGLLSSILGPDEFGKVRYSGVLEADGQIDADLIGEFLGVIFQEVYNVEPGESGAS
jgi:hypothetical protein